MKLSKQWSENNLEKNWIINIIYQRNHELEGVNEESRKMKKKKQINSNEKQKGKKQFGKDWIRSFTLYIWFRSPENQQMMEG